MSSPCGILLAITVDLTSPSGLVIVYYILIVYYVKWPCNNNTPCNNNAVVVLTSFKRSIQVKYNAAATIVFFNGMATSFWLLRYIVVQSTGNIHVHVQLVYIEYIPLHHHKQAPLTHKHILININKVYNILMGSSTPVQIYLTTSLGNISKNLC